MTLAEVGVGGQVVDVAHGGDVGPEGRLLSVAELQRAVRDLRRGSTRTAPTAPVLSPAAAVPWVAGAAATPGPGNDPGPPGRVPGPGLGLGFGAASGMAAAWPAVGRGWVAVVAAHSGAGASAVALAIADAAAGSDRPAHLVDLAVPGRSGLAGTAETEHGGDPAQGWRRGRRGAVVVDRRAGTEPPAGWPPAAPGAAVTVLDVGFPAGTGVGDLAVPGALLVAVCRATVPGVRAVEQLLDRAGRARVVCAVLGPRRWPGEVAASAGPRLRQLREKRLVVAVPLDRHLEVRGLSTAPLPKGVLVTGKALLALVDDKDEDKNGGGDGAGFVAAPPRRRRGLSREGRSA